MSVCSLILQLICLANFACSLFIIFIIYFLFLSICTAYKGFNKILYRIDVIKEILEQIYSLFFQEKFVTNWPCWMQWQSRWNWSYRQPFHSILSKEWRHNIQHNDTQHNDTQHNDTQHNGTKGKAQYGWTCLDQPLLY